MRDDGQRTEVEIALGRLAGLETSGVRVFRGIPFFQTNPRRASLRSKARLRAATSTGGRSLQAPGTACKSAPTPLVGSGWTGF